MISLRKRRRVQKATMGMEGFTTITQRALALGMGLQPLITIHGRPELGGAPRSVSCELRCGVPPRFSHVMDLEATKKRGESFYRRAAYRFGFPPFLQHPTRLILTSSRQRHLSTRIYSRHTCPVRPLVLPNG